VVSSARVRSHPLVQRVLRNPALLAALVILVALVPRLILLPMGGHPLDLERHYRASAFMIDNGFLKMYDSPIGINHPPIGVLLYAGSTWVWTVLGGDISGPYDPGDGWLNVALKAPKLLFEIALLVLAFYLVLRHAGVEWAAFITCLVAFSPGNLATVAGKGQTDAMFVFFLVLSIWALKVRRPHLAWIAYAVGWLCKFQCIMLLPIMVLFTWKRHGWRVLIVDVIMFAATIAAGMLPFILTSGEVALFPYGRGSVDHFPFVTTTTYNLWYWVSGAERTTRTLDSTELALGISYFQAGMLLFCLVTALICLRVALLPERDDEYLVAATAGVAFFMFPTQIHARYLYTGLIFLALALWQHPRLIPVYLGFAITFTHNSFDTMHLGSALVYYPSKLFFWDETWTAVANTVLTVILLAAVLRPLWEARRELPERIRGILTTVPPSAP
jgi:hypothetical protein